MKHKGKAWIITLICLVAVAGIAACIWFFMGKQTSEPVKVFPFMQMGMTEYWGDSQESYGPVTTDQVQTVFLSETQSIIDTPAITAWH